MKQQQKQQEQQKKQIVLILSLLVLSISFISIGNQTLKSNDTSSGNINSTMNFATSSSNHKEGKEISTYLGDANLDGKVNSSDALLILNMTTGSAKPNAIADVNQDGKITQDDASIVVNISAKKKSKTSVKVYKDNNGRVSILYKQNDSTNKSVAYKGRYNHGEYLATWKKKNITAKKTTDNPTLGGNGCGPTSAAIIATSFGKIVNPKKLVNNNTTGYSTTDDLINYFKSENLKASVIDTNTTAFSYDNYVNAINANKKVMILLGTSKNYSTVKGKIGTKTLKEGSFHWVTILDYRIKNKKTEFYIGDPYLYSGIANCKWIESSKLTGIYASILVSQ